MNPVARFTGFAVLGLAIVGLVHVVTDPPNFDLEPPSLSLPAFDNRPRVAVDQGMRLTFDHPTSWDLSPDATTEIWLCDGTSRIIEGAARVDNVCGMAVYNK